MPGTTSETIAIGPATYTISGGVEKTLVKIDSSKAFAGEYYFNESDGSQAYRLQISNTFKTVTPSSGPTSGQASESLRNYINFTRTTPATATTAAKVEVVSVAISGPTTSNAGLKAMLMGLAGFLNAANIDKLRQGQS